jgi:hypothetical protein
MVQYACTRVTVCLTAATLQGYVLGQYGLLYALAHEEQISRLFILNTPLALSSKLRPELAAYKSPIPFMRPGNVSRCSRSRSSSSSSSSWCLHLQHVLQAMVQLQAKVLSHVLLALQVVRLFWRLALDRRCVVLVTTLLAYTHACTSACQTLSIT